MARPPRSSKKCNTKVNAVVARRGLPSHDQKDCSAGLAMPVTAATV
eukprot:CAMPEP_0119560580 /NCGR_PEP_ID=MMETSP1352-20130426/15321_1 /TAXON_ID=265584 /ORGANISM="Stauroneis constricta, Strain CCMP1120" /LENGTH=45 /DNA_ID= /DNA_START= /DNA_END= /DNA_ORIENTATION=